MSVTRPSSYRKGTARDGFAPFDRVPVIWFQDISGIDVGVALRRGGRCRSAIVLC